MIHISRVSYCVWHRCRMIVCAPSVHGNICLSAARCYKYGQLRNGQMFHSQFVNRNGCRLVTVSDESEVSQRLCELQTTNELLNFISVVDSDIWTPELSSLLNERLVSTHYQSLCAIYPWLHENVFVASKQLRLGDSLVLHDAAAPVHLHVAYRTWMDIVERSCTSYNPDQLASALLSATELFVDYESSLFHFLLSETHRRLPCFGLSPLAAVSNTLKALPGNNEVLVRLLLKRMQTLLFTVQSPSATELTSIAAVFSNLKRFLRTDFKNEFAALILRMIQSNKEVLVNPACVTAYFLIGHLLSFKCKNIPQMLLDTVVETCQKYEDQLDISNVSQMCDLLHSGRKSYYILRDVFCILESRAVHLLSDDSRLYEVVNLMTCLSRHTSPQVVLQFYSALHSRLMCNEYIDIFSLASIARILTRMPSVNVDLLALFQHLIVCQAHNIVQFPQIFISVERFLSRHHFLDKDVEKQFNDHLLSYVRRHDGIGTNYVTSIVSAYLLPVVSDGLPAPVFKRVITAVDEWSGGILHKHSSRLSSVWSVLSSSHHSHQLNKVNSVIYQRLCKQLDSVHSLDSLNSVTCSLLKHRCQLHPVVTDRVMNMYERYSSTLSDSNNASRIASVLLKLDYYLPAVYDDLVHYVVSTDNVVSDELVLRILFACARVGYLPHHANELLRLARSSYHKLIARRKYNYALSVLYSLVKLQLFPDEELSKLFSLEGLEDLDLFMADNQGNHRVINSTEMCLMYLNRAIVLDCPHLDVPWFRHRALKVFVDKVTCLCCNQNLDSEVKCSTHYIVAMIDEVRDVVSEVLGGFNYMQSGVSTQYHYYLDFQCLLDERQKPIDVSQWSHADETGNCQKIAICVLGRKNYCYNSRHLTGNLLTKKRHLEITNYKFVEIPHFDWFSMGLSDKKAKRNYIEKKLFQ